MDKVKNNTVELEIPPCCASGECNNSCDGPCCNKEETKVEEENIFPHFCDFCKKMTSCRSEDGHNDNCECSDGISFHSKSFSCHLRCLVRAMKKLSLRMDELE